MPVSMPLGLRLLSVFSHWITRLRIRLARAIEYLEGWLRLVRALPAMMGLMRDGGKQDKGVLDPKGDGWFFNNRDSFPIIYINLDKRIDRAQETLLEFAKVDAHNVARFSAIAHEHGGIGCSKSHLQVLQSLKNSPFTAAMICEDDVEFLASPQEIEEYVYEFLQRPELGVLCLSYRVRGGRLPVSPRLAISNNIQTTGCYLVKPFAVEALERSFSQSVRKLEAGEPWRVAALDQLWKEVQSREIIFAIPQRPLARQRRSYSDIAEQIKFYD